jgi:hypothetical protein
VHGAADLDVAEVVEVYRSSGLGERRPIADAERSSSTGFSS